METFAGTLTPSTSGVTFAGAIGCGEMVTSCNQEFTVELKKDGAAWSGTVEPKGGAGDWWLAGSTLVVDDASGYGGEAYGAAWGE